jgi:hypothetical protein
MMTTTLQFGLNGEHVLLDAPTLGDTIGQYQSYLHD